MLDRFGLFNHESFSDLIVETVNMIASLVTPIVDEFFFILFSRVPQEPFICDRFPVVIYFSVFSDLLIALFDICFSLLFKHHHSLWCKFPFHFLFPFRPLACPLFPCCDYIITCFRHFVNTFLKSFLKKAKKENGRQNRPFPLLLHIRSVCKCCSPFA